RPLETSAQTNIRHRQSTARRGVNAFGIAVPAWDKRTRLDRSDFESRLRGLSRYNAHYKKYSYRYAPHFQLRSGSGSSSSSALAFMSDVTSTGRPNVRYLVCETKSLYAPFATRTSATPCSSVTALYGCITTRAPLSGV